MKEANKTMSRKEKRQPIKVVRISKTDFEIHCDNEYWADQVDSLFRDMCGFPAEYKNKLIGPTSKFILSKHSTIR